MPDACACACAGIRTGYCGSLTTFGTWQLDLMVPAIQQSSLVRATGELCHGGGGGEASFTNPASTF